MEDHVGIYLKAVLALEHISILWGKGVLHCSTTVHGSYIKNAQTPHCVISVEIPFVPLPMSNLEEVAQQFHKAKCDIKHSLLEKVSKVLLENHPGELATA